MKQKIEIEVPEGKIAIWDEKRQKIIFKDIEPWKKIKTFDDVLKYLEISKKEFEIVQNSQIPINKWQLIMEAFLEASNDKCYLTEGNIYYPYCFIVYDGEHAFNDREIEICSCIINNKKCTLVSSYANGYLLDGIGCSVSNRVVSTSGISVGFRGFSSRQVAEHVSRFFAKELIEFSIGWRTDEIQWL